MVTLWIPPSQISAVDERVAKSPGCGLVQLQRRGKSLIV